MWKNIFQGKKFVGSNIIRLNICFMIVFVLNIVIGFAYMAYSVQANYQKVREAADLGIQLLKLETALIDQETGQRGFLLTREVEFLEPFDKGVKDYVQVAASLMKQAETVSEHSDFQQDIIRLIRIGESWKNEYGDIQVRKVMAGGTITNAELLRSKGKFDSFRVLEADLLERVEKLRDEQREEMLHSLYYLFALLGTGFIIIQLFKLYYLQRGLGRITQPIIQLDQAVASYKAGHIRHSLPVYREDDEIGRLVNNFGLMHEEMQKEKHDLQETYRMINVLNQARSVEDAYRIALQSTCSLIPCERLSIITQNGDRSFSIKAVFENGVFHYRDIPLEGEEKEMYEMLQRGFSIFHDDWSKYRPKGPLTEALYEKGVRSSLHIILKKEFRVLGVLNLSSAQSHHFSALKKERLEMLSPMIVTALENATETTRIQDMALHDGLTGIWNRRHFDQCLDRLVMRSEQKGAGHTFSLILLDVDHFKLFNDTWGHPEGDLVLKHLAQLLETSVRPGDIPVRYGGEEFAVLLPETGLEEAKIAAERIRKRLESESPSRKYTLTASFGIAEWSSRMDRQELIRFADEALYQAKESGRNRVCVYPSETGE